MSMHEILQDVMLAFVALILAANCAMLALHLRDHRQWRETELEGRQYVGGLH